MTKPFRFGVAVLLALSVNACATRTLSTTDKLNREVARTWKRTTISS